MYVQERQFCVGAVLYCIVLYCVTWMVVASPLWEKVEDQPSYDTLIDEVPGGNYKTHQIDHLVFGGGLLLEGTVPHRSQSYT